MHACCFWHNVVIHCCLSQSCLQQQAYNITLINSIKSEDWWLCSEQIPVLTSVTNHMVNYESLTLLALLTLNCISFNFLMLSTSSWLNKMLLLEWRVGMGWYCSLVTATSMYAETNLAVSKKCQFQTCNSVKEDHDSCINYCFEPGSVWGRQIIIPTNQHISVLFRYITSWFKGSADWLTAPFCFSVVIVNINVYMSVIILSFQNSFENYYFLFSFFIDLMPGLRDLCQKFALLWLLQNKKVSPLLL